MSTTIHLTIPLAVHRWLQFGEAWTYHPDFAVQGGSLDHHLIEAIERAGYLSSPNSTEAPVTFVVGVSQGRLVGTLAMDPECPDVQGRAQRPYILRVGLVKQSVPPTADPLIHQAISEYFPTRGGIDAQAAVKIRLATPRPLPSTTTVRKHLASLAVVTTTALLCLFLVGGAKSESIIEKMERYLGRPFNRQPSTASSPSEHPDAAVSRKIVVMNTMLDPLFMKPASANFATSETVLFSRLRQICIWQRGLTSPPSTLDELMSREQEIEGSVIRLGGLPRTSLADLTHLHARSTGLLAARHDRDVLRRLVDTTDKAQQVEIPSGTSRFDPLRPVLELIRRLPRAARLKVTAGQPECELCQWQETEVSFAMELARQLRDAQLGDLVEVMRFLKTSDSHPTERKLAIECIDGLIKCGFLGE